jgi:hypothetical protein
MAGCVKVTGLGDLRIGADAWAISRWDRLRSSMRTGWRDDWEIWCVAVGIGYEVYILEALRHVHRDGVFVCWIIHVMDLHIPGLLVYGSK